MNGTKEVLLDVVVIAASLVLFLLIVLLFLWIFGLVGRGMKVLPFDIAITQSKYNGNTISDLLINELHRINVINKLESRGIHVSSERISLPQLAPSRENIDSSIENLGTIGMGDSQLSIGNLLMILKRLWPIGDPGSSLTGSLHKEGSTLVLMARLEDKNIKSWKVSSSTKSDNYLPCMVRDIAFKIAKDKSSECKAKTWEGFKLFTEALYNYHLFIQTNNQKYLQLSQDNCMKAKTIEGGYESLLDLFYNLGSAYLNKRDGSQAKAMFLCAISIKPNANAYNGLGNYYLRQEDFEEAQLAFEIALDLDPGNPYAYNGIGNVSTRKMRFIANSDKQALFKTCEAAIKAYDAALSLNPESAYSWNGKGNAYYEMVVRYCDPEKYYKEALDSYFNAIILDANYSREAIFYEIPKFHTVYRNTYPWNGIGNVYTAMARWEADRNLANEYCEMAMEAYDNSTIIDPINPYPWNAKGDLHSIMMNLSKKKKQRHYQLAIDSYKRALLLKQEYEHSLEGIGRVFRDAKEYEKAIERYEEMIDLKISPGSVFISLAECYSLIKKQSDRKKEINRVYIRLKAAMEDKKIKKIRLNSIYCSHEKDFLKDNAKNPEIERFSELFEFNPS